MKKTVIFILTLVISTGMFSVPATSRAASADPSAGVVATGQSRLNVRREKSTGSAAVASLNKGSYITLVTRSGSWWQVEYARGKYGYCYADYIRTVSSAASTVQTQSGNLNVRSGTGTSYAIIGQLAKGETVIVLSDAGGWSKILYHGTKIGYVSSRYLSQTQYRAISLSVPSFKQTDSRWANVQIQNTGKTIAQIGCATTGIAMMESYRTGTVIYPDAMSKKLRYTASGNLYWPENYRTVTDASGYLAAVYSQLKQGKPVLLGARKANGSQHWVVITGFTGGNTLTASRFTVNDPGSGNRTTLQQLLNEYPVFYKFLYY
jgi:uncharacterized protein YgiM (DUF1202 family)